MQGRGVGQSTILSWQKVLEEGTAMKVQNCLDILWEVMTMWNSKMEKRLGTSWGRGKNQILEDYLFAVGWVNNEQTFSEKTLYENSNHEHLRETENLDLFLLQNAGKGGHESHNIGHVPEGEPGLTGVMTWVLAVKQYALDQGKERFTSVPRCTKHANNEIQDDDAHME